MKEKEGRSRQPNIPVRSSNRRKGEAVSPTPLRRNTQYQKEDAKKEPRPRRPSAQRPFEEQHPEEGRSRQPNVPAKKHTVSEEDAKKEPRPRLRMDTSRASTWSSVIGIIGFLFPILEVEECSRVSLRNDLKRMQTQCSVTNQ